jgi:iron complex outermembrane receptor protein
MIRHNLSVAVSMLAIASASPAFAQSADPVTPDAVASAPAAPTAPSAVANTAEPAADTGGIRDIVVTARRREESAQTVPVAVTAFSAEALEARSVRTLQDLSSVVAGFRFSSEGGKNTNNVTLRGLSRIPLGEGVPAVVSYFADVPLPGEGSNIPTFDLGNVQVLKGPQGTLFGRNTIGGAVLISPQAPTYEVEGYAKASYGNYDYWQLEGALNIPIVADKVALRVAGQIRRRDGVTKNLSGGKDFDDIHSNAFRASLLLQPTDTIKNTTVFDWMKADEQPAGGRIFSTRPNLNALSPILDPQINAYLVAERDEGFHSAFASPSIDQAARRKIWGVSNDTRVEIGDVTIRNIFGYRRVDSYQRIDSAGTGQIVLPGAFGAAFGLPASATPIPFTLLEASALIDRKYLTDEVQVLGTLFDGKLDWIVGGFYGHDKSAGPMGSNFKAFAPVASPANFTSSHVENKNYAVFGQAGVDLSDLVTEGLKLNLGFRYSWDKVRACAGGVVADRYATAGECEEKAALNALDGTGIIRAKSDKPSWTIGLDYKLSDSVFTYITSRRGYRGANVNTPLFETPFTTGGAGCLVGGAPVPCPDLRPVQTTKPEQLTDVEFGIKTDWRAGDVRGRFNVAVFYSKYKNALEFANVSGVGIPSSAPDQPTNTAVGINLADETIKGIEFDATIMPTHTLTLTLTGAFTDSKVDKEVAPPIPGLTTPGVTLPTPDFSGSAAVSWTLPVRPLDGDLVLSADYYYTEKFGGSNGLPLPGYDLANARLDWNNVAASGIDVGVFLRNVFGEKYFVAASQFSPSFPVNTAYTGEPRTYGIDARVRF